MTFTLDPPLDDCTDPWPAASRKMIEINIVIRPMNPTYWRFFMEATNAQRTAKARAQKDQNAA